VLEDKIKKTLVLLCPVTEAVVHSYRQDIKDQGICCYVTLIKGVEQGDELNKELVNIVRDENGLIALPDVY